MIFLTLGKWQSFSKFNVFVSCFCVPYIYLFIWISKSKSYMSWLPFEYLLKLLRLLLLLLLLRTIFDDYISTSISLLSHHQYGRKSVLLASQLHLFFRRINEYIRAPLAAERIRVYRSIRGLRELGGLRDKSSLTRIGSRSDQPLLTSLYFSRVSSPYRLVNASEYAKNRARVSRFLPLSLLARLKPNHLDRKSNRKYPTVANRYLHTHFFPSNETGDRVRALDNVRATKLEKWHLTVDSRTIIFLRRREQFIPFYDWKYTTSLFNVLIR